LQVETCVIRVWIVDWYRWIERYLYVVQEAAVRCRMRQVHLGVRQFRCCEVTLAGCRRGLLHMQNGSDQQNKSDESYECQASFQVDQFKSHFSLRSQRRHKLVAQQDAFASRSEVALAVEHHPPGAARSRKFNQLFVEIFGFVYFL